MSNAEEKLVKSLTAESIEYAEEKAREYNVEGVCQLEVGDVLGTPARNPAADVPAPPWWQTAAKLSDFEQGLYCHLMIDGVFKQVE